MKKTLYVVFLISLVGGFVSFQQPNTQKTQITIYNDTDFAIDHFYVSPVNKNQWGPDQLGDHPEDYIGIGESFTLKDIPCGTYDLKIVAENGLTCIIEDAVLCADGTYEWHLTEEHLCDK